MMHSLRRIGIRRPPTSSPGRKSHVVRPTLFRAAPVRGRRVAELPKTADRKARKAELEIRATRVTLKPPHARGRLPQVTLNVVLVEEVNGPDDGTDVSWLLLTTLPIGTLVEILLVLDDYMARWIIEVYFRTLKTGCRVEEIHRMTDFATAWLAFGPQRE